MRAAAVVLGAIVLGAIVLGSCGGDVPAQTTQAGVNDAAAGDEGCVDRFVQVYEDFAESATPVDTRRACFDETPEAGPPRYPTRSRTVRLEYDRGDYYAVEDSAEWIIGETFDLARQCVVVRLERTRTVERRVNRAKETKRITPQGEKAGGNILLGSGPGSLPTAGAVMEEVLREDSPFGTCLRANVLGGSLCSLEQAPACKSNSVMLPIEIRFPNALGGTQVGRTTSLERGAVDKSSWVMP